MEHGNQSTVTHFPVLETAESRDGGFAEATHPEGQPCSKAKHLPSRSERLLWCDLAQYQHDPLAELGKGDLPFGLFDQLTEKMRERIVELLGVLPPQALEDFCSLVVLIERCLERMQFLTDSVLHSFLEREKGEEEQEEDPRDRRRYARFWTHKLFRELEVVEDLVDRCPLHLLVEAYEDRLCDRLLEEEVLL